MTHKNFVPPDNQCRCWDITLKEDAIDKDGLIELLKEFCKKWVFQLEVGSQSGYRHWQIRISLDSKGERDPRWRISYPCHWSVTCKSNTLGNKFYSYCTKDFTREDGPWCDKDKSEEKIYIPIRFREMELRPFQKTMMDLSRQNESRYINLIVDDKGNLGKSTVGCWAQLFEGGFKVPAINDGKELVQSVENYCRTRNIRVCSPMIIDLPRAMPKKSLNGIYTGIEIIKEGFLYDVRNKYKQWVIEPPCVWVFTNTEPDLRLVSMDRWRLWKIVDDQLIETPMVSAGDKTSNLLPYDIGKILKKEEEERKLIESLAFSY